MTVNPLPRPGVDPDMIPLPPPPPALVYAHPAEPAALEAKTKKYQATATVKDDRNNTKTFTDHCEAKSNGEATTIFKARYPEARVSGVREA